LAFNTSGNLSSTGLSAILIESPAAGGVSIETGTSDGNGSGGACGARGGAGVAAAGRAGA